MCEEKKRIMTFTLAWTLLVSLGLALHAKSEAMIRTFVEKIHKYFNMEEFHQRNVCRLKLIFP